MSPGKRSGSIITWVCPQLKNERMAVKLESAFTDPYDLHQIAVLLSFNYVAECAGDE